MLLAVDVGNTHTVLGLFDGDDLVEHWRVATEAHRTADEIAVLLRGLLAERHSPEVVDGIALCSTVPSVLHEMRDMIRRYYGDRCSEGHLLMARVPEGARLVASAAIPWPTVVMRNVWVLPGVPEVVASGMTAPAPPSVEREAAPQPVSRKSRLAAGAGSRAAAREAAIAKTDRASRIAVAGDAAAHGGDGTADTEPHRAPPPPHGFAPTVVATGPAMPFDAPASASPIVTAAALDANRLSGERKVVPDEITLGALGRAGGDTLISSFKICVASDGNISSITQLRGTGFPAYDAKIQGTIRRDWRYRPFVINGKPTAVCSTVRFVYAQR